MLSCKQETGRFVRLSPASTHIAFDNTILQDDSFNVFEFPNIFNGGGVGVGDFNNDGWEDLYFTGNLVPNKLYLNRGGMKFEDITAKSGTDGNGAWSRGVSVVDINNDGKLDIYVSATAKPDPAKRKNLLYINQGNDQDGTCRFNEMAEEYGLADTTQSTMSYFFDYDNDGDLDLFIAVNHVIKDEYANVFRKRNLDGEHPSTGKLYRNDWNDSLGHAWFTDVSRAAGILIEGYTHAANIADFNQDGWLDIMEANDYASNNVLYINNRNGTFTDRTMDYFKHTAFNSMGSDAVDINNDGLFDVVEVDMLPQDNYRKKMFQSPSSYQTYQNTELFGYQYQYPRNVLQVNRGPSLTEGDSVRHAVFSDLGFYSGLAETDWSWCPLVADFDQDGNKDIIFTNGFPKDITDRDFMTYRSHAKRLTTEKEMLEAIPEVKIHNYAYRNKGELRFDDVSYAWGLGEPTFSNGAVYADLDNDGDLDMVINNINDPAGIYENRINEATTTRPHYLSVKLNGPGGNINGIGAKITFYQKDKQQYFENTPYRGYLSTQSMTICAGMGEDGEIDSVVITWPDHKRLRFADVATNQVLFADYNKAQYGRTDTLPQTYTAGWFNNITRSTGIQFVHGQRDYIDFNKQRMLPHKFSEYAPAIAAGDINGDGRDDLVVGASPGKIPELFFQKANGRFNSGPLYHLPAVDQKKSDDRCLLLFDADNDGDLDLYIASGGYSYKKNDPAYQDQFFLNDGKGHFMPDAAAIPVNTTSKLCVRAVDYDKDGDLDLFVSGRVDPWEYPKPVSSFIYRNDSQAGSVHFTDVTPSVAPGLQNLGMVADALFSDYDNDGWPDLILAGEWMPIVFLHNENGVFKDQSSRSGLQEKKGWWNSLTAGDFDRDGDIDYIAGNEGLNSFYRASDQRPVSIRAGDFDDNGSFDAIPSLYLPSTLDENTTVEEYPAYGRDDMIKQMLSTRVRYPDYKRFAWATMDSLIPAAKMKGAIHLSVNYLASVYIENKGNGEFAMKELPYPAQWSPLCGMVSSDFDGDGNLDVLVSGNDFGTEPVMGRYDAMNGLLLKGKGNGTFSVIDLLHSGIYIGGDARGLVSFQGADGSQRIAATQNRGPLLIFRNQHPLVTIPLQRDDAFLVITGKDGRKEKSECYYGTSFLSQSSRKAHLAENAASVWIYDNKGKKREWKAGQSPD